MRVLEFKVRHDQLWKPYMVGLDFHLMKGNVSPEQFGHNVIELISQMTLMLLGGKNGFYRGLEGEEIPEGYGLVLMPVDKASEERCFRRVGAWKSWGWYDRNVKRSEEVEVVEDESDQLSYLKRLMTRERLRII